MGISTLGLGVALGAGAAWAGLDATRKALVREVDPTAAAAWVNLVQGPLFVAWAAATGQLALEAGYWPVGLATLALQVVANLALFHALSVSPLSATIPFLSFTPVFASLFGVLVLDERLAAVQWLGVAVVIAGGLVIHSGGGGILRGLREERGSWMAIVVAGIWSLTSNLDKLALEHASLPTHAAIQSGGVGVAAALWLIARRRGAALRLGRESVGALAAAIAFATAALALQLWAIQLLLVGVVETIKRALGLVSAVVIGRAAFDEPITPRKLVAIALLCAGTALLALAPS